MADQITEIIQPLGSMAVWRTKAYESFGFTAGDYSFARGKVELFADLIVMAQHADNQQDSHLLDRIAEYVCWAAKQNSDALQSAVDLAFFLPMLRDPMLSESFQGRLPHELIAEKSRLLLEVPDARESYGG